MLYKHTMEYEINAAGKKLGRVASEAAKALMGKAHASYMPHIPSNVRVTVAHAGKIHLSERKKRETYVRYSGYPGGLKRETLRALTHRRGIEEALRRTVRGMLPRNRLLTQRMRSLKITE